MNKQAKDNNIFKILAVLLAAALVIGVTLLLGHLYGDEIDPPAAGQVVAHQPEEVSVTVLDVGQGDCIVIIAGETVVMVDAGDSGAREAIFGFLDANGIAEIDYLVATHPHADHIGSMQAVIENYEVGRILFSNVPNGILPTTKTYLNLLTCIDQLDVPLEIPKTGDRFKLDMGTLTVLSDGGYNDLNNCSLVVMYEYGDTRFLLIGDAEKAVEEALLQRGADLRCDVLKAGHHGSDTSSMATFLAAASPSYIAVSCKTGNTYGHPHEAFLERVAATGATLFRTDTGGVITFISDGEAIDILAAEEAA